MDTPLNLQVERDAVIAEVYAAFANVTREGGVSWSESFVIDDYGSDDERRAAREEDTDTSWTQLADDPAWDPGSGSGGWSFLDPIGTRYYLPAAMIRAVNDGDEAFSCFTLDMCLPKGDKLSAFDARQLRCIARFVRFMYERKKAAAADPRAVDESGWAKAYHRRWRQVT